MSKVIHVTEDVSKASGGIRTVVFDLHNQLDDSIILSTQKDQDDDQVTEFEKSGPWQFSKALKNHLKQVDENCIFHLHGVWMHAQYTAAKTAHHRNIPFVVSPHGMYEPWLWKEGALKKKIFFELLTCSAFAKARYIHAITPDEQQNLQKLFPKTEVVCIPNAIEVQELPEKRPPSTPYFLFLGRLHHKKGLELLLNVFSEMKRLDYDLYVAGTQNEYSQKLKSRFKHDSRIKFLGAVRGLKKRELYRNAQAFIAPSYSEVVGMVNIEAAMMATPVITTFQTGLYKEWHDKGGVLINPEYDELKNAIKIAASWGQKERTDRGLELRKFVIQEYSWKVNRPKWLELYDLM